MLLTSQPVENTDDARERLCWYGFRWVVEEWHRVVKEGCCVERSQLDDVLDLCRLTAMCGVVSVRLLQLRELGESIDGRGDSPEALQQIAPSLLIELAARLAGLNVCTLTPKQFLLPIAKRGGYLGRKRDPRPGWKVLWRGFEDIQRMAEGVALLRAPPICG